MERSYDFIMDFLQRLDRSEAYALDPAGNDQLHLAKRVRRSALMRGGTDSLIEEVGRHFGLPPVTLPYARALPSPLYTAAGYTSSSS
jgi:hypothetical protein